MSASLSHRRIGWLLVVFAVLLALAGVRALQLTTLDAGHLSGVAETEHASTITVPAARGQILDRNGDTLAVTAAAFDVTATPQIVRAHPRAPALLAPWVHLPAATIAARLAQPTTPEWTRIAAQVSPAAARRIKALRIPGIALSSDPRRVYPNNDLAAQVLGGVGTDGGGLSGLELRFNRQLHGTPGIQHAVYAADGQAIHVTGTTPVAGSTLGLTLDGALQQETEHVLDATAARFRPLHATAIVLDPRSNAILAVANWPRVNANNPAAVGLSKDYSVQLNYEPGSTFKIVAIGGALSDGLISPSTAFSIPSAYHVADRVIHDSDSHPTETLSTKQILAYSSNIGAVKIGQLLLNEDPASNRMYHWMRRYGFGSTTGVDLPGEQQGIVPSPSIWSGSSIGNLPIGQGEEVTPLQMATAYAAIANGGLLRQPHIVASVGGRHVAIPRAHRILSERVAHELRGMLEGVLAPGGTAAEIQIPGYRLAGKTGTANKVVNGTYSNKDYVASFVGFAPARNPKIEAVVVIDQPSTGYIYGTEVAAPAWEQIMNFALPYLKISPR